MTPAMEEIVQLRKKSMHPVIAISKPTSPASSPRLTRSRVAHLKRKPKFEIPSNQRKKKKNQI